MKVVGNLVRHCSKKVKASGDSVGNDPDEDLWSYGQIETFIVPLIVPSIPNLIAFLGLWKSLHLYTKTYWAMCMAFRRLLSRLRNLTVVQSDHSQKS